MVGPQLAGVLDEHEPLGRVGQATAARPSSVVLPEPVPPLTRNASPATTTARSSRSPPVESVPAATSSASVKPRARGTRSEISGAGPGDRRQHGVEAGAVGEPDVDVRTRVVEPAPTERGQPLREPAYGGLVGEPDVGRLAARHRGRGRPRRGR